MLSQALGSSLLNTIPTYIGLDEASKQFLQEQAGRLSLWADGFDNGGLLKVLGQSSSLGISAVRSLVKIGQLLLESMYASGNVTLRF